MVSDAGERDTRRNDGRAAWSPADWNVRDRASRFTITASAIGTHLAVAAVWLACAFAVDPGNQAWGAARFPALKYLPLELAALSAACFVLVPRRERRMAWPLASILALAALVAIGSLLTIAGGASIEESFLGRALGVVAVYPAFRMFGSPALTARFAKAVWAPMLVGGLAITAMLALWLSGARFVDQPHIFHEEIFLPVAAAGIAIVAVRDSAWRMVLAAALIFAGALTVKNTGYLATLLMLALVAWIWWRNAAVSADTVRPAVRGLLVSAVVWGVVLSVAVVVFFRDVLPSGSPKVRVFTYLVRLGEFVQSPLVGTWWLGSPILQHPFSPSFRQPSHSDVLDILAFGGLLGFCLFAIPAALLVIRAIRRLPADYRARHWLSVFYVGVAVQFLMAMTFNPMWNQPELVLHFWFAMGFFAARSARRPSRVTDPARRISFASSARHDSLAGRPA
jgi:hypothetical protein